MNTLVFLHGAGGTGATFDSQTAAFPGSIALALPGHGTPGAPQTIDDFADAVCAELDRRDLNEVVLAGFSMGGAIALAVALRHPPRVRALALLGAGSRMRVAPAILEGLENDFAATAKTIAGYLFAEATPERVARVVGMMHEVGQEQCRRDFGACNAFDVTERLGEIDLPVVAITGDRDVMTPPKYAAALADRIPGASARILEGAGHLAAVERPDELNEALRAFVIQR